MSRYCPTQDVDIAAGSGDAVSVLHHDGEVAMVSSDGVTHHQSRLAPVSLVQTQTLSHGSHKLLLWFWNLQETKLELKASNTLKDSGLCDVSERTQTLALVFFLWTTGTLFLVGSLVTSSSFLSQVTLGYGEPEMKASIRISSPFFTHTPDCTRACRVTFGFSENRGRNLKFKPRTFSFL